MDLATLILELMTSMFLMATKPFSLIKISCIFGLRSLCIVIQTWIEILKDAIGLHFGIIRKIITWTYAIISLPSRVVYALQRESLLQSQLYELQMEIEKLLWSKKELEVRLQKSIREFKMMEAMLTEVEDEHDEAIVKIEQLENKLKSAKDENLHLKEVHGELQWTSQNADNSPKTKSRDNNIAEKSRISPVTRQLNPKKSSKSDSPTNTVTRNDMLDTYTNEYLGQRALLQFAFSSILSLLVGMIIYEAEDPCMPLVIALFTVVIMSLKSTVQFFSSIENKPASDAVALLCLNWFILGALAYPTLPKIPYMLTKMVVSWSGHR